MTRKPLLPEHKPKVIAFDLDATLWFPEVSAVAIRSLLRWHRMQGFRCRRAADTYLYLQMYMLDGPPFKLSHCGTAVIDAAGERTKLMVREGIVLARTSCSRTTLGAC